ncbi:MAG: DUF4266 domain-containing protein [Bacteroidetes bacterium]|nr:DUF4266 domain-containing protein [Bacteroidota bacterium]
MKKKNLPVVAAGAVLLGLAASGCANVKAYQKNKLNDGEMELSARKAERPENSFQTYREGASGANGGKVGGGCGCN